MDFSKPVHIKASARLIYHLGEQLISDELVGLLELIKNCYDADATNVQVIVENDKETPFGKGEIIIKDNGNGMLPSTIVNSFLRLATNYKNENKFSPYYKRRALGEKGLGRLSFQRLGKYIEVVTVPRTSRLSTDDEMDREYIEKYNQFNIEMDWDGFTQDADFDEITANIKPSYNQDAQYGTCIKINGIRNMNFWELNKEKRARLQSEILSITNPFVAQKTDERFNLTIDINGEKFFVDSIEESIVEQLSDVSVKFSMENGILSIESDIKEKYFNRTKTEYLRKQKEQKMCLNEDNGRYSDYKTHNITIDFKELEQVKNKIPWIKEDIFNKINNKYAVDFSFSGKFYAVDMQAANKSEISEKLLNESIYIQKNFTKIGALWKQISGIYVYRDKFRVLPYGETDWIGFTALSQKSKATIYKQGNVTGYIKIDGSKSEKLKEQTNRQGILQDEIGFNFINILSRVIAQQVFQWDTNSFRANFAAPKLNKVENLFFNADKTISFWEAKDLSKEYKAAEKKLDKTINDTINNSNSGQMRFFDDSAGEISSQVQEFKRASTEYNDGLQQKLNIANLKIEEYKNILPLLGQSIIMETVTHEFYRIYGKLASSLNQLAQICNEQPELSQELKYQLRLIVQAFQHEINDIDMQLNHIAPTHRNKLKDEIMIDHKKFLIENYVTNGVMAMQLKEKNIRCDVMGESFISKMSKGNAIVIFDNLVLNSEYWLDKFAIMQAQINFEVSTRDSNMITIWDNGLGIDKEVENILFEPFISKKEMGRGLGLYIVQELLALTGATIELLPDRNKHNNKYKFKIEFPRDNK